MTMWQSRMLGGVGLALVLACAGACKDEPAAARQPSQAQAPGQQQPSQQQQPQQKQQQPQQQQQQPRATQARMDPHATAVVRRMSSYLGKLPAFTATADSMTEVVLRDGQKIQALARSTIAVQRPNKLRSVRLGQVAHLQLTYDGSKMILVNTRRNQYAMNDAPKTLDAALDYARDKLGVEAPGADLLYTDVYEGLMQHTRSGQYLGETEVRGVRCDHVAFRGERADWELWVQQGSRPLPMRYVITTTDQSTQPEFSVNISHWNTSPTFSPAEFATTPPPNGKRVNFATLFENVRAAAKAAARASGVQVEPKKGRGK